MSMLVRSSIKRAALALIALSIGAGIADFPDRAWGQDDWKPFAEPEKRRTPRTAPQADATRPPPLAPMDTINGRPRDSRDRPAELVPTEDGAAGQRTFNPAQRSNPGQAAPLPERDIKIERSDLPPVLAADGSGLPGEIWRGLDAGAFEQLIAALSLPPRSPALHGLWKRVITADVGQAPSDENGRRFLAVRVEALDRTGLVAEELRLLEPSANESALLAALAARARIGQGDSESGCEALKTAVAGKAALPARLRAEMLLLAGYCAATAKNLPAVQLSADLLREEGAEVAFGAALLDAIAAGEKPKMTFPRQIGTTELRLMEVAGIGDPVQIIERATPATLAALTAGTGGEPRLRMLAAETAARINVLAPEQLAEAWRVQTFAAQELGDALNAKVDPALRRALLFRAAEAERTPFKKTRIIRALLDDARRAGLYLATLQAIGRQVEAIVPAQEISWFAETAVEVHLATGAFGRARDWIDLAGTNVAPGGGTGIQHWLALADIADPALSGPRGTSLSSVEALALRGRYSADLLHRLATVLDALDYNVPVPLWEAASRSPQPTTGHLPATGVLSQLQDAAKKGEIARTALLAMQALGPAGGEGAHMIALGDAIRALKRAKLDAEARRLGFEALFAGWPRTSAQ
jgi:hypothetical protein